MGPNSFSDTFQNLSETLVVVGPGKNSSQVEFQVGSEYNKIVMLHFMRKVIFIMFLKMMLIVMVYLRTMVMVSVNMMIWTNILTNQK